jgi:hypothetical protein
MEFAELQRRMGTVHAARGARTIVVVPSRAIDKWHEPPAEAQAYEERLLCQVLSLRDPGLRLVYVTSSPVAPRIADYHLSLLEPALRQSARDRLTLLSARDGSVRPLAGKLLEQPRLLTQIRWAINGGGPCHLAPYMSTAHEREVALALGIPMYAADPCAARFGTKTGSRELFAQAGVPHPLGVERVHDAVEAIANLRAIEPALQQVVVKLDAGVAGEGNAIADLRGLPEPGAADERARIAQRLARMEPEAGVTANAFLAKLQAGGGIVEERIGGRDVRSPSVQLELTPAGEVVVVSTHDQMLDGQCYLGCRFPAEPAYASTITALARKVGRELASAGVIGRCAIDFVTVDGAAYAIEVNLRKGGTTHPYAALEHLTGGSYDSATATFTTPDGTAKHYVASDHVDCEASLDDVLRGPLAFARGRGIALHMLSAVDSLGRVGLTAVGDTAADAQRRFDDACLWLRERRPASVAA